MGGAVWVCFNAFGVFNCCVLSVFGCLLGVCRFWFYFVDLDLVCLGWDLLD